MNILEKCCKYLTANNYEFADFGIYTKKSDADYFSIQIEVDDREISVRFIDSRICASEGKWINRLSFDQFLCVVNNLELMNDYFLEKFEEYGVGMDTNGEIQVKGDLR